ncbi:MAG: phenylalanine--tRNA ligase subunit beta [Chloroflexi bacterium]|nr:phenylalanine--tRNA ligase subunit beta [Chloroflexota bacterium]
MKVPLSWLKEYVDIDVPAEVLAERLTLAGLEVEGIVYLGVPQTAAADLPHLAIPKSDHLVWDRQKILLAAIREVKAHPNADKLVLALVDTGSRIEQCVTGAPNLFPYKEQGPLLAPLWTAFADEGAEVWDGHSDTPKRMILREKALRGIPNKSMVCSEKELGLSEAHEGVILMHEQPRDVYGQPFAPGTPLQDVLGDVVFDIALTPNLARCYSILGVAREVAALLGKEARPPSYEVVMQGDAIEGQVAVEIRDAELNPRFTLALIRDVTIQPSPEWMQRRLRLVDQRPINNIVDVTNYITFEIGQPLHAFDYDKLVARAGGKAPKIITRLPHAGETLATLDEAQRALDAHNILVCDTAGALSLGGIIGGAETEISDSTTNVLLEAANWNFINIRRTMQTQRVQTDAGLRFSRGVHPSQALLGVKRGAELMRQSGGGTVAQGVIDVYPHPLLRTQIELPMNEVRRLMGVDIEIGRAAAILTALGFDVLRGTDALLVTVPDNRLDIGEGVVGQADLVEEIARIYGYDNLPDTIMADAMPPQWNNVDLQREERTRDLLVALGLREIISYRFTTPEAEARIVPPGASTPWSQTPFVTLANPMTADKTVLRHTLLVNLLETARSNIRFTRRQQVFEIGSVYHPRAEQLLPDEPRRLGLLLTGPRRVTDWTGSDGAENVDYFDLKGVVEGLLQGLHIPGVAYTRAAHPSFHPGRSALLTINGAPAGTFGELHPQVARAYELTDAPVLLAELDLDLLLQHAEENHPVTPLRMQPPVLQDIALVVTEQTPNAQVEAVIAAAGGEMLKSVRLFDVYRGDPIPAGQKSLAYNLVYQSDERTLTDREVAKVHSNIVRACERELNAKLRA